MKVEEISIPSGSYYIELSCQLRAKSYILTLRFNTRTAGWTCDVGDSTGKRLAAGIALRSGRNALAGLYSNPSIPQGALFVYDTTGANLDPGKDSFSTTHRLLFISP